MAVELVFVGHSNDKKESFEIRVFATEENEISISIKDVWDFDNNTKYICLDKSTSIKLSKELRKQIALLF